MLTRLTRAQALSCQAAAYEQCLAESEVSSSRRTTELNGVSEKPDVGVRIVSWRSMFGAVRDFGLFCERSI